MKKRYNFLYETNASGSYLVLRLLEQEIIKYQLEMLTNNQIPYLIPLHTRYQDGEVFISYYITSKQPLFKLVERRRITLGQLLELLQGICRALLEANVYLLSEANYLLDFQHLYVNPVSFEVSIIYLPIELKGMEDNTELRQLFNKLLLYVTADEETSNIHIHNLFLEINREDFSIGGLLNLILDIKLKLSASDKEFPPLDIPSDSSFKLDKQLKEVADYSRLNIVDLLKPNRDKLILIFSQILMLVIFLLLVLEEATGVIRAGEIDWPRLTGIALLLGVFDYFVVKRLLKPPLKEEVKVDMLNSRNVKTKKEVKGKLEKNSHNKPLKSSREGYTENSHRPINDTQLIKLEDLAHLSIIINGIKERVTISQPSFIIGKLKEQVDLILDNKAISRLHAEITYREGAYYIKDLNSRNGTFLNGVRIESNKNYLLSNGDSIAFADQSCNFQKTEKQCTIQA